MRLISIVPTNFGKIANEKLTFGKGLTVVKGPNEAGKSFSIEAVTQGLYGDASSGSAYIREHCLKWGSEGAFSLELEIESGGKEYKIIRDFENKKNILIMADGTQIQDKESVRKQVSELVGLPSQIAFEATACIPQEEVEEIGSAVSTLREIIEGRLAGSGMDTDKIVKKINRAIERICSKSGRLGELIETEGEITDLTNDLRAKQERLRELIDNKKEVEKIGLKLQEATKKLMDKENAFKGSQEYISAQNKYEKAEKEFESTQENLDKHKKAQESIQNAAKELKPSKAELENLSSIIKNREDHHEADVKCKELETKATDLRKKISTLEKLEADIQGKRKDIESYKKVDHTVLQNARSIPAEINGLRMSLVEQLFGIKVDLEKDIKFSIISDGKMVKGSEAEMHVEATVVFPGFASVLVKNLTGKEKPIVNEIERKEGVLKGLLDKYEVKKVEELEELYNKRTKAISEKDNLEIRRETLLVGKDLSYFKVDLKNIEKELLRKDQIRERLKHFAMAAVELEKTKRNKQGLEIKIRELGDVIARSQGILAAIGDDESKLQTIKKEAAKELAKTDAILEEKKVYKCTPEAFAKLKRETEALQEEVQKLNRRQIELCVRIEQETLGTEDIAVLEERLSELENKKNRLNHKYELLKIVNDNITWAREKSIARFSNSIGDQMSIILSKITDGKYKKVKVDENLGVSLYSEEKGEYINIDDKIDQLSSGTVDQVYLAARLAILSLLAAEEKPPIILDDTFVTFDDMGRKERAFKILELIAKDYQVIYFTCHDCPKGLKIVEISQ